MSGIINVGGSTTTEGDITLTSTTGDVVFVSTAGEILFKTTAGEVLRLRIPNSGSPTVEISGDLNLTAGSQYKVNGVPISGGGSFVDGEAPSGLINGANVTYTLASAPIAGSVHLYLNGSLQEAGGSNDYTIVGDTITMTVAPSTGSKLLANYRI